MPWLSRWTWPDAILTFFFYSFSFVLCIRMMAAIVEEEETIEDRAADNVRSFNARPTALITVKFLTK